VKIRSGEPVEKASPEKMGKNLTGRERFFYELALMLLDGIN